MNLKKNILLFSSAVAFAFVGIAIFIAWEKYATHREDNTYMIAQNELVAKHTGRVLGEGENPGDELKYNSGNFSVPQVGTGSVLLNYTSDEDQWALDISETKNEIFSDKNKNYKKMSLSWKTQKPAKCSLKYAKAGSAEEKIFTEDNFSMDHSVMLEKIDSASTYNYTIIAKDRWGEEKESDKFAVYTGAPDVSFLDLLTGAFKDTFGWAVR